MSKSFEMSGSEALLEKNSFNTDEMITAVAKDLYKGMVDRIETEAPELEFDKVHKLAILNAAEFCKQCIEETEGRYDEKEKVIMALVGKRLMEMFEDEFGTKSEADNA